MYRFFKISFLRCLDDLQFKCIFHKQSESRSKSGCEKNNFGSTTLLITYTKLKLMHSIVYNYHPAYLRHIFELSKQYDLTMISAMQINLPSHILGLNYLKNPCFFASQLNGTPCLILNLKNKNK